MAARTKKIRHDEETRAKIKASQIINRFQKCIDGEIELTSQQVSCGKTLLDKVLPDLKSVDVDANHNHDISDPMKDFLTRIAESGKKVHE